jgi:hypothetical protein
MFSETQLTKTASELLDLAHQVATETDPLHNRVVSYEDWYSPSNEYRGEYFEICVAPISEDGVSYFAKIDEPKDCSCCPASTFAYGRGSSLQESLDNLRANILAHMPSHTVGDEWRPTLGDLLAS